MDLEEVLETFYYKVSSLKKYFSLYKLIKINYKQANKYSYVFYTILSSLEKTFFVELVKLLDDREQRSLYSFIDICKKEEKKFNSSIELNKYLESLNKLLKDQKLKIALKKYRDKYFVHNDKEYFINPQKIFKENPIKNNEFEKIYSLYIPIVDLADGQLEMQFEELINLI